MVIKKVPIRGMSAGSCRYSQPINPPSPPPDKPKEK